MEASIPRRYLLKQNLRTLKLEQCSLATNSTLSHHSRPNYRFRWQPLFLQQSRSVHSRRHVSSVVIPDSVGDTSAVEPVTASSSTSSLSCLPLSTLIRSYVITAVSSHPILLKPSLTILNYLAHSKSPFFNPDSNPLLKMVLKRTFYAQFCAGETESEVRRTIADLKNIGYKGVILGHAKEVVLSKADAEQLDASVDKVEQADSNAKDIDEWKVNILHTIQLAEKDDFVALKFTGAGKQALQHLKATIPCAPAFEAAVHEICQLAQKKQVALLFDAEQASLQQAIDNWTMYFASKYNKGDQALVYGTYQAYAKRTPSELARHLQLAQDEGFILGVKLVRGAYLGSDPRELFWPTIERTHECYDGIAESLIKREYGEVLKAVKGGCSFPRVDLVLASHNAESVKRAGQLRDQQAQQGVARIRLAYGQLMGMADNVSCELVQKARANAQLNNTQIDIPQAYKYLVWGTMGECMKYLLRRAQENRDAVSRTVDARMALGQELRRRLKFVHGNL